MNTSFSALASRKHVFGLQGVANHIRCIGFGYDDRHARLLLEHVDAFLCTAEMSGHG